MMTNLHFALISDIHISSLGNHHDLLSGQSADILANILAHLNQIEDLDFVLITGDLFDVANQAEFDQFQAVIRTLKHPYYLIPGNHDRRKADQSEGLTRRQFAQYFNPQIDDRPTAPEAQVGYWSISVHPEVQLIGLDSIRDKDWGGVIDALQVEWLKAELAAHANKLILVAVHHPLHKVAPIDEHPDWSNYVCDNGPDILALLDQQPQVKVVLTGHHHLTQVDKLAQRLHIANPSICIYPCAYRTLRLHKNGGQWQLEWQTHKATDEKTIAKAHQVMLTGWQEIGFEADFVKEMAAIAFGRNHDRNGKAIL